MTAYWTCTRCKRELPHRAGFVGEHEPDGAEDPEVIRRRYVCRACCKEAIEASKEKKGDG